MHLTNLYWFEKSNPVTTPFGMRPSGPRDSFEIKIEEKKRIKTEG